MFFSAVSRSPQRTGMGLLCNQKSSHKPPPGREAGTPRKGRVEAAENLQPQAGLLLKPFAPPVNMFWNSLVPGWGGAGADAEREFPALQLCYMIRSNPALPGSKIPSS